MTCCSMSWRLQHRLYDTGWRRIGTTCNAGSRMHAAQESISVFEPKRQWCCHMLEAGSLPSKCRQVAHPHARRAQCPQQEDLFEELCLRRRSPLHKSIQGRAFRELYFVGVCVCTLWGHNRKQAEESCHKIESS